ncbi:MAG TPA: nuclear transport factor 2 family protein [Bryobacteraceae bacterium]
MALVDDNKKLVQGLYDAFGRGDIGYILDRVTDDVEWVTEGPQSIPYAGSFKGRAGAQSFFEKLSAVEGGKVIAQELIAAEDQVVGLGRFAGTVKTTKKKIDSAIAHVFTIRGGKVSRWLGYADTARVAEAFSAQ